MLHREELQLIGCTSAVGMCGARYTAWLSYVCEEVVKHAYQSDNIIIKCISTCHLLKVFLDPVFYATRVQL